jgi:hypothetical protein
MKALDGLFSPRSRRIYTLGIYTVLLVAILSLAFVFAVILLSRSHTVFADKLAEIADVLAGGTLLLAMVGGLVALQAYAAATGLPDLELQVRFEYSQENRPIFRGSVAENGWVEATSPTSQTMATILIRNRSSYSAKNPALILRLVAMTFARRKEDDDWLVIEADDGGATAVQWDGGPTYSIHGDSIRRLPPLHLVSLRYLPGSGKPTLTFELLSDGGYRRRTCLAVEFVNAANSTESLTAGDGGMKEAAKWI